MSTGKQFIKHLREGNITDAVDTIKQDLQEQSQAGIKNIRQQALINMGFVSKSSTFDLTEGQAPETWESATVVTTVGTGVVQSVQHVNESTDVETVDVLIDESVVRVDLDGKPV